MIRRKAERGFSLVETLVGLAILSGVLIATYAAMTTALTAAYRIMIRQQAVEVVEREFSLIRARQSFPSKTLEGETAHYAWRLTVEKGPLGMTASIIPYRVTGVIARKGGDGVGEVVFDTILLGRRK